MAESVEESTARYQRAIHAMQSGVKAEQDLVPPTHEQSASSPKHLRVGVNAAMSSNGALAKLLIDKGILTEEELMSAVADSMEGEQETYEKRLSEAYGATIKLA